MAIKQNEGDPFMISTEINQVIDKVCKEVSHLCRPIFETFDINFFQFVRTYINGKAIFATSHNQWNRYALEQNLFAKLDGFPNFAFRKISDLSKAERDSDFYREILIPLEEKFDVTQLVLYFKHGLKQSDFFVFGVPSHVENFSIAFRTYFPYFKKFSSYFTNEFNGSISELKKKYSVSVIEYFLKFIKNNQIEEVKNDKLNIFDEKITPKRIFLTADNKHYLTQREFDCIKHLIKSKSYKLVANELNIGQRTVQDYMNNIRAKLNLCSKRELLDFLEEHFYIQYRDLIDSPANVFIKSEDNSNIFKNAVIDRITIMADSNDILV